LAVTTFVTEADERVRLGASGVAAPLAQGRPGGRILELDAVRGLAAVTVVIGHSVIVFPNIERNPYEPRRTTAGDILFATGAGGLFRIAGVEPETFRADLVELGLLQPRRPVTEPIFHIADRQAWAWMRSSLWRKTGRTCRVCLRSRWRCSTIHWSL